MDFIAIPSRGRSDRKITADMFKDDPHGVYVEPQQLEAYQARFPATTIALDKNDMGIAYARNFMNDDLKARGIGRAWVIDDDMDFFVVRRGGKSVRVPPKEALEAAEAEFKKIGGVAIGALQYNTWVRDDHKKPTINSSCCTCVWFDYDLLKDLRYDDLMMRFSDADFTLQALRSGLKSARINTIGFAAKPVGKNPGGLHHIYSDQTAVFSAACRILNRHGPDLIRIVGLETGDIKIRVNWPRLK
jgi:hypothetical protein